jgi:hypothetical protein
MIPSLYLLSRILQTLPFAPNPLLATINFTALKSFAISYMQVYHLLSVFASRKKTICNDDLASKWATEDILTHTLTTQHASKEYEYDFQQLPGF